MGKEGCSLFIRGETPEGLGGRVAGADYVDEPALVMGAGGGRARTTERRSVAGVQPILRRGQSTGAKTMKRILSVVLLGVFGAVIPGTAAGGLFSPGEIYMANNTCEDLRIAVHFKERFTEGKWRTVCCWNFTPGEEAYLVEGDERLRGEGDVIYVWVEGFDRSGFSEELSIDGRKFKKVVDGGYDFDIEFIKFGRKYSSGNCPQDASVWLSG